MKFKHQAPLTRRAAKLSVLASLLFLTLAALASSPAKADTIFNINGTITSSGPYLGDAVAGTVTIDTATGQADAIDVYSPSNAFTPLTNIQGGSCPSPICVYIFSPGYTEFGPLLLGDIVGYTGGSIGAGSFLDLGSIAYAVTGTVTPVPEPAPLALLALGITGLFFLFRRRLLPSR